VFHISIWGFEAKAPRGDGNVPGCMTLMIHLMVAYVGQSVTKLQNWNHFTY